MQLIISSYLLKTVYNRTDINVVDKVVVVIYPCLKMYPTAFSYVITGIRYILANSTELHPTALSTVIMQQIKFSYLIKSFILQPKPVKGLQNALFQSVLHQMKNVPPEYEAKHLRRQLIKDLCVNRDTYSVSKLNHYNSLL